MKIWRISVSMLLLLSAVVHAGNYEQAQIAEEHENWDEAIRLYQLVVQEQPENLSAWLRMSDVYARMEAWSEAGEALREAGRHHPDQADVFYRAARAFAEAGQPEPGLEMARRAVELEPGNPDYLEARGNLAGWLGMNDLAIESFERALEASPARTWVILSLGLNKAWAGEVDEGADLLHRYLETHPERTDVLLHLVDFEIWRGNYAGAFDVLEDYREQAGEDRAYRAKRARIMAWSGQRDDVMAMLDTLLAESPEDPGLHYSRALALRDTQPGLALESLALVERLVPGTPDTIDLGRSTRMPLRSRLMLELDAFWDSDSIRTRAATLAASHHLGTATRVEAAAQRRRWEADTGSGLEPEDGSNSIKNTRYHVGVSHRLNRDWIVDLHLGRNEIDGLDGAWLWGGGLRWRLSDRISFGLAHDRDLFAISPRTVSNRLQRRATTASINLRPALAHHVHLSGSYQDINDGNARRAGSAAYRYEWIRSQRWNIDAGFSGGYVSFREDLNTGYYSPRRFRTGGLDLTAYWKLSDDDGIGFNYSVGAQKDETFNNAKVFQDVSVDAVFGIFRDWMIRVRGGYSDRQNQAGGFDAQSASIRLERRF